MQDTSNYIHNMRYSLYNRNFESPGSLVVSILMVLNSCLAAIGNLKNHTQKVANKTTERRLNMQVQPTSKRRVPYKK